MGLDVVLLERECFPRAHVGESLLPGSIPILESLGVMDEVRDAGFTVKPGATMIWGTEREPWSWYFSETHASNPHSYQVWRPEFDSILLNNARRSGVDVREGWQVTRVVLDVDGVASAVRCRPVDGSSRRGRAVCQICGGRERTERCAGSPVGVAGVGRLLSQPRGIWLLQGQRAPAGA